MDERDNSPLHPLHPPEHGIAVVERRTGVSQHLLRAWERRYGVVNPVRDETGQRLYSDVDIERLRLIREVVASGRRIGHVARLSMDELRELARRDAAESISPAQAVSHHPTPGVAAEGADAHLHACLESVARLDSENVHALLTRAAVTLGPRLFIDGVAAPLLDRVGREWETGKLRPMHEHVLSVAMRSVLARLLGALPAPLDAPLIAFGTLPDQRHEFGAMLAAVTAAAAGWRVLYLGPDLPVNEIAHGALIAGAAVVAVSILTPADARGLGRDIEALHELLPPSVSIVVGGSAAIHHSRMIRSKGVTLLGDLAAWDEWLRRTSAALAGAGPST